LTFLLRKEEPGVVRDSLRVFAKSLFDSILWGRRRFRLNT
jgi:hypothetical protein